MLGLILCVGLTRCHSVSLTITTNPLPVRLMKELRLIKSLHWPRVSHQRHTTNFRTLHVLPVKQRFHPSGTMSKMRELSTSWGGLLNSLFHTPPFLGAREELCPMFRRRNERQLLQVTWGYFILLQVK